MEDNDDITPGCFRRMLAMGWYERYDKYVLQEVANLPIRISPIYKSIPCVACFAIVFYQLLMSHHDIFLEEITRRVYCKESDETFGPLAKAMQKYLRFTNEKFWVFSTQDGAQVAFTPRWDLVNEFCAEDNLGWRSVFRLARSFFGVIFLGICWVGICTKFEAVYPPFIIYGVITFFLDWHYWLDDIVTIFQSSTIATRMTIGLSIVSGACLLITMWNVYSEFSDLLVMRHNPRRPEQNNEAERNAARLRLEGGRGPA